MTVHVKPSRNHTRPKRESWCSWIPSSPHQRRQAELDMLHPIDGLYTQAQYGNLNTIYYKHPDPAAETVVLLHGFAGGCALWIQNWKDLIAKYTVYAVDLPGFGRSVRVPYKGKNTDHSVYYFLTQIEEWIKLSGVSTPFALVGHSLGGYLSSYFTMKHPQYVSKLVLADPWGVPNPDYAMYEAVPWKWKMLSKVVLNWNPLAFFRAMGPWAPDIFAKRRSDVPTKYKDTHDDPHVVTDYIYHSNADDPTGESAFYYMFHGFAWARKPLEEDFPKHVDPTIPVSIIYGRNTWVTTEAGERMLSKLPQKDVGEVVYIEDAGHNVFSDNYKDFNANLLRILSKGRAPLPAS